MCYLVIPHLTSMTAGGWWQKCSISRFEWWTGRNPTQTLAGTSIAIGGSGGGGGHPGGTSPGPGGSAGGAVLNLVWWWWWFWTRW